MAKRVIILRGEPIVNELGAAAAVIEPGMLVEGVTSISPFSTAGGPGPRNFALERDELGRGIGNPQVGSESPNYAINDTVKVASFAPGQRVNALIASGQNIAADAWLEPAADGTLRAHSAGTRIGRAVQAVDNSAGPGKAHIEVEVY